MKINWYPGHMKKNFDKMLEYLKNVDFILYVLDARAPLSCINPQFNDIFFKKQILYTINKVDLVYEEKLIPFINFLKQSGKVLKINSKDTVRSRKILIDFIFLICQEKLIKYEKKDIKINLNGMVIGVPNTGKSTIINLLAKRKKVATANIAGVTKFITLQRILKNLSIYDTPGILYPNVDNQNAMINLAIIGCLNQNVVDEEELLLSLIDKIGFEVFLNYYNIECCSKDKIIIEIAKKRNCFQKGKVINEKKVINIILEDFRNGKLGKFILDKI